MIGIDVVASPPERPSRSIHAARVSAPPLAAAVLRSMVRVQELLATARVIWLSTIRPDGRPHVVPVWFDWDGEVVTVFTRANSQKVRNVRHQPRMMLAIGQPEPCFEVELLEAEIVALDETGDVLASARPSTRFETKYAGALAETGRDLESFVAEFPHALRIRPTRLLDWGAREASQQATA
jgi:PPOX class probable F420-dependent enzyme